MESIARSRIQGPEVAWGRLVTAMQRGVKPNRLWGQRYDVFSETPLGSDVITDGFYLAQGSLMGALNIRTSLLGGVEVLGPAAQALWGANYTFALGGQNVVVGVSPVDGMPSVL